MDYVNEAEPVIIEDEPSPVETEDIEAVNAAITRAGYNHAQMEHPAPADTITEPVAVEPIIEPVNYEYNND